MVVPSPDPIGLPAPAWLLQTLLVFTFVLHVLAMNFLVGGVTMMALAGRKAGGSRFHAKLRDRLSKALPVTMAMTITLGIAPLLFLQVLYGQFFYTSSILMAWPWMAVIPLLILSYYGLYIVQFKPDWLGGKGTAVSWAAALMILAVGLLFTANSTLMLDPGKWTALYSKSAYGLHLNLGDDGIWARYLHFIVGGFAVSGLGLALLARWYRGEDPDWAEQARQCGVKWFLGATLLNFLIGPWFLFSLPEPVRMQFLGRSQFDTAMLWLGVVIALAAMHFASKSIPLAAGLIAVTVAMMSIVRHRLRTHLLEGQWSADALQVSPQWSVFAVFAVLLVAGVAIVAWMLIRLAKPRAQET
jgi:hypothetical protein